MTRSENSSDAVSSSPTQEGPLVDPDKALDIVCRTAMTLPATRTPLASAGGLVLAQAVASDRDYPPFARSTMDGYAVNLHDAGRKVPIVGEIAAGSVTQHAVRPGQCLAIMTGAPCPAGCNAIIKKEDVHREGDRVTLPQEISPGQFIAKQGSECTAGHAVLMPGEIISPLTVAVLATVGCEFVEVVPRPRVAMITTGAELVSAGNAPGPAKIRDSNGPMILAMARDMGIDDTSHNSVVDRLDAIIDTLHDAADADLILLSGGVSVGNYDLVPEAVTRYGATTIFHRVAQKPGKPLLLAKKGRQLIFGLPGNPLGCHLGFHRYVASAIRIMTGRDAAPTQISGVLAEPFKPKRGRTFFVPARVEATYGDATQWRVYPLPGASSADIFTSCRATCYVEVPPGKTELPAGTPLAIHWIGRTP